MLSEHLFCHFFFIPGDKRNPEPSFFFIKISSAVAGELDRCPHLLENLEIIIKTTFGNADFLGAVGRSAGAFQSDKVIESDEAVE